MVNAVSQKSILAPSKRSIPSRTPGPAVGWGEKEKEKEKEEETERGGEEVGAEAGDIIARKGNYM